MSKNLSNCKQWLESNPTEEQIKEKIIFIHGRVGEMTEEDSPLKEDYYSVIDFLEFQVQTTSYDDSRLSEDIEDQTILEYENTNALLKVPSNNPNSYLSQEVDSDVKKIVDADEKRRVFKRLMNELGVKDIKKLNYSENKSDCASAS